ncbi:3-methyladenine DNA glycosylase [Rariglobus hedericola]|uniref:3-methyladenine DNA glycosylase n=1 Tax=Rariglobus hedericola TaxID=2597822 RepID=A0A556QIX4_9BACT|nr:3-methyladenine DNA glycosylase [Rariglobus hedericola]TSJ76588.1 3-methyladenine DNA glycosylase [Rariglobus hedericola]
MISAQSSQLLPETEWRDRQRAHEARVASWADPHLARASRGEKHPVYDFLFSYYSFRASWLRQWHPGPDVLLGGDAAREFLRWPEYRETPDGVQVDSSTLTDKRRVSISWMRDLLAAMTTRAPAFACFGLHEWAMVYRQTPEEIRHNAYPLRFPPDELARIVESQPVRCTHFDAFRFFTAPARPLNKLQPERTSVTEHEQRGCLHANMDLYKWAFKLAPFTPSDLIADCFALARDIREMDMRASPYDLRALGFAPLMIETPEGRLDYERQQRAFATRGEPLRARLLSLCERLLAE